VAAAGLDPAGLDTAGLDAAGLDDGVLRHPLPLTARLEATFATRLDTLEADSRTLLLLAALDDGDLAELSRAAALLLEAPVYLADWTRTASAGLGSVEGDRFRFGHPLMRSAVQRAATDNQRRRTHAALAQALAGNQDRAVWHRAAAAAGPDESVAEALVAAAERATSRGALDAAFAALEQAAALTADPQRRAVRIRDAADVALESGAAERSLALHREALHLGLPAHDAVRSSYVLESMSNAWSGPAVVPRFVEIAEQLAAGGDDRLALDTIATVDMRAYLGPLDDGARQHVSAIVAGLDVPADDPQRLAALALLDPVHRGRGVIGHLRQMTPVGLVRARDLTLVGEAASAVWADNLAAPFLRAAVDGHRAEGRLVWLGQTLVLQAWVDARRGAVRDAITVADEAARVAGETRQTRYVAVAHLAHAVAAAGLGDEETATRLIAGAEAALLPMGAHPLLALVALARGRTALAAERPTEAYTELVRIFTPTDTAYQPFVQGWALADLAEAAVHGEGDLHLVRRILRTWRQVAADTTAPHLEVQVAYASALLAEEQVQGAMTFDAPGWPFYAARARLALGEGLRRQHRDAEARTPLREAARTFDALGQRRYADRALRELRATGERARRRTPEAWTELSPQELQIAQLAAEGLSNREIGQRLYLSHRTIGTHLYNLFPKLGITSRAQLRDALEPHATREA
jgi:DNA-binding CsgD family transcriptional regulator